MSVDSRSAAWIVALARQLFADSGTFDGAAVADIDDRLTQPQLRDTPPGHQRADRVAQLPVPIGFNLRAHRCHPPMLCPCCDGEGLVLCFDDTIVSCELCDGARISNPRTVARTYRALFAGD